MCDNCFYQSSYTSCSDLLREAVMVLLDPGRHEAAAVEADQRRVAERGPGLLVPRCRDPAAADQLRITVTLRGAALVSNAPPGGRHPGPRWSARPGRAPPPRRCRPRCRSQSSAATRRCSGDDDSPCLPTLESRRRCARTSTLAPSAASASRNSVAVSQAGAVSAW